MRTKTRKARNVNKRRDRTSRRGRRGRKIQKGGWHIEDLYGAITYVDYPHAIDILEENPNFLNQKDANGDTPLMLAIKSAKRHNTSAELIDLLLYKRADVNISNDNGITPLHLASMYNVSRLVQKLINKRAIIDAKDIKNNTPLIYACMNNDGINVVKLLISNGANINLKGEGGNTPLHIASSKNNFVIVEELFKNNVDTSGINNNGKTALDLAAENDSIDVLKYLLDKNIKVSYYTFDKAIHHRFSPQVNDILLRAYNEGVMRVGNENDEDEDDEDFSEDFSDDEDEDDEDFSEDFSDDEDEDEEAEEAEALNSSPIPTNAPLKCFDPLMASNTNIEEGSAVFYIQNEQGKTLSAGCLDEDTLDNYKNNSNWIFYRCKETTPVSALSIVRERDTYPTKYRLLNFAMRIYVKDSQAQSLVAGKKYVLKPIEPLGRIVSENFFQSGNAVSAVHCGPADGSMLYKIFEVRTEGGRRKTRKRRQKRQKSQKKSQKKRN